MSKKLSRRDFIQIGGLATTGAVLMNPLTATSAAFWRNNSDTLKVGLVGCGGRGTAAAEEALNADKNVVLTAMADAFKDHLDASYEKLKESMKEKVQVPEDKKFVGLDAYQRLIDSDVDVVLLATPPFFRPLHLEACVNAGKHLFCEKPFAVDGPGMRRVIAAAKQAKEKNIALVSGFVWRSHFPKRETFKRVLNGDLGKIMTAEATYDTGELWSFERQKGWSDFEYQLRNWLYYSWLSGDHIIEQAIHSLDMMQWALGDQLPVRVVGSGGRQKRIDPKYGNIFDHFALRYEYENGITGYFSCRQQSNTSNSYGVKFFGEAGSCVVDVLTGEHEITGKNPWKFDSETTFGNDKAYENQETRGMYQVEHDELFASIRNNKPRYDGDWMVKSNLVALAGRMAGYTGQTVSIEDALASEAILVKPEDASWDMEYNMPVAIPGFTTKI